MTPLAVSSTNYPEQIYQNASERTLTDKTYKFWRLRFKKCFLGEMKGEEVGEDAPVFLKRPKEKNHTQKKHKILEEKKISFVFQKKSFSSLQKVNNKRISVRVRS